jgi:hypothetical protein
MKYEDDYEYDSGRGGLDLKFYWRGTEKKLNIAD